MMSKGASDPGQGSGRGLTVKLKKTAGRSVASQRWLTRQLNDPYVAAAQKQGWRSRAAFKLIELDDRSTSSIPACACSTSAPPPAAGRRWR